MDYHMAVEASSLLIIRRPRPSFNPFVLNSKLPTFTHNYNKIPIPSSKRRYPSCQLQLFISNSFNFNSNPHVFFRSITRPKPLITLNATNQPVPPSSSSTVQQQQQQIHIITKLLLKGGIIVFTAMLLLVRELAEKEPENGVFRMLRSDVTRFLTTILIGTTNLKIMPFTFRVVNIGATAMVTEAATAIFGEAGVTAATGIMTVVILLLTEITPKSIAVHNATDVARLLFANFVFTVPLGQASGMAFFGIVSRGKSSHISIHGNAKTARSQRSKELQTINSTDSAIHDCEPYVTEDELKLMLRGAELSGAIEEEEQDMIENVLEIKDTHVREVMTPLVDVVAIDASSTLVDFHHLWETNQYSRVPVFEQRVDNIVGIAYAMDLLDFVRKGEILESTTVGVMAQKPAYFVPGNPLIYYDVDDSMSVWNLLREFRIRKVHMAVVLNEYGGTVGIVTLEDVVEEIVGEIFDENDSKEEIQKKTGNIVMRAKGMYDVDANTSIDQLSEDLNIKMPEGHQYETVSGFICEAFGYIPKTGECINVVLEKEKEDDDNEQTEGGSDSHDKEKTQIFKLEILAANARKVKAVRFELVSNNVDLEAKDVTRLVPKLVKKWSSEEGMGSSVNHDEKLLQNTEQDKISDDYVIDDFDDESDTHS
ncbi:hypothetical protein ACFE04_007571 [Oxalis oulophora]